MIMKLFKKLCQALGKCEDQGIVDDMYVTNRTNAELLDIFHTQLGFISEGRGIHYFDAFVEHMFDSGVNVNIRSEVEMYLCRNGLCPDDIKKLTDKFYEASDNNG